jgi:hypothetical protein
MKRESHALMTKGTLSSATTCIAGKTTEGTTEKAVKESRARLHVAVSGHLVRSTPPWTAREEPEEARPERSLDCTVTCMSSVHVQMAFRTGDVAARIPLVGF